MRVYVYMAITCISGTPVADWTPSSTDARKGGDLWVAHMVPLLPMTFRAALWDQVRVRVKVRVRVIVRVGVSVSVRVRVRVSARVRV